MLCSHVGHNGISSYPLFTTEEAEMDPLWVALIVVWAVVEFIQYLRKKPFRSRMKTGAWWGVILTTLAGYGQHSNPEFRLLLVGFAMTGLVALAIYWARVGVAKVWTSAASKKA
jgi:CDP-diglyceride synthetase